MVIGAGVHAMQEAYLKSFEMVWIAAAVFSGVTAIGKSLMLRTVVKHFSQLLTSRSTASCFFINPTSEFNDHVDAPLEKQLEPEDKAVREHSV